MSPPDSVPIVAKPPRRRRWLNWAKWIAVTGLALLLLLRLALALALPSVMAKVGRAHGVDIRWETHSVGILPGYFELWNLTITPLPAADGSGQPAAAPAEPLLTLDYVTFDAEVAELLRGELRVRRLEVDGLTANLERGADGSFAIERAFASTAPASPTPEAPVVADPPTTSAPRPIEFDLPLELDALRLANVQVHLVDRFATPAIDRRLELDLRISDVGVLERRTRIDFSLMCPGVCDRLRVQGTARAKGAGAEVQLALQAQGVHPRQLESLLARVGIVPRAEQIDFGLKADVHLEALPPDRTALRAEVHVQELALKDDLQEAVAVDDLDLVVDSLSATSIDVQRLHLRGVRGRAERLADGTLRLAGLDLVGAAESDPKPEPPADDAPPRAIRVAEVRLEAGELRFRDAAAQPAADLELAIDSLSVAGLVMDPAHPDVHVSLAARLRAPGIVDAIALDADVAPFAADRTFALTLALSGIRPERLAPYLSASGLTCDLERGALALRLEGHARSDAQGRLAADVDLAGVEYSDGAQLFGMERLAIHGVDMDPEARTLAIGSVALSGTRMQARRTPDGEMRAFGFRFGAPASPASPAPAAASVTPAPAAPDIPPPPAAAPFAVTLGEILVSDTQAHMIDATLSPALDVVLGDLTLTVKGLRLGAGAAAPAPATLELRAVLPGIVDELNLSGTVAARPDPLDASADLSLGVHGLVADVVGPYLVAAGVEPSGLDASLDLKLHATAAKRAGEDLHAELLLSDLALRNADSHVVSLDRLAVNDLTSGSGGLRVGDVALGALAVTAQRAEDGALIACGLRLSPPASAPQAALAPQTELRKAPPDAPAAAASPGTGVAVDHVSVGAVTLHWRDAAVQPAVDTDVTVRATVDGIALGQSGASPEAMHFDVGLGVRDVLAELAVKGSVRAADGDLSAQLALDAHGITPQGVQGYLPKDLESRLTDGRLKLDLDAAVRDHPEGGHAVRVVLSGVDWRDGSSAEPLFALESFTVDAPRLDPAAGAGVFTLAELAWKGLDVTVVKRSATELEALGFAIRSAPPVDSAPTATAEAAAPAAVASAPPTSAESRSKSPLPAVRIDRLDLDCARVRLTDATRSAVPLVISARLSNGAPLQFSEPEDDQELPPIELRLTGAAAPLVRNFGLDVHAAPFAAEPEAKFDLVVDGLQGAELAQLAPDFAERIDARALSDARFEAHASATLQVKRRGPLDFDLAHGFGLEAALENVRLTGTPGGPTLAGLTALRVDVERFVPATGDMHIERLELNKPEARIRKTADGLELAGILLKTPPTPASAEPAATAPASETVPAADAAAPEGSPSPSATKPPEVRIDELLVSGLAVLVRDDSVDPPMVLPLEDLDLEVARFTTRAFREPVPLRFSAILHAGEIELPKRDRSAAFGLGRLLPSDSQPPEPAADAPGAAAAAEGTESRHAFDEIALSGNVTLVPLPKGWVHLDVVAFELPNLRGLAKPSGLTIGDGVVDSSVRLSLEGEQGAKLDSTTTFSSLSLSEAGDGPITRLLSLSAPLDSVLFVLKNSDGEQKIPLSLRVGRESVSGLELARAATTTLGTMIGTAIAASPLRLGGTATDLLGLTGGATEAEPREADVTLGYAAGSAVLQSDAAQEFESVVEKLKDEKETIVVLRAELGRGDLAFAERLANPQADFCRALAERLRRKKAELQRVRQEVAAAARADYLVGSSDSAASQTRRLRDLDREIGFTEQALDRVFELLRPGAERGRERRTTEAALTISRFRLARARLALLDKGIADPRIDVREPRMTFAPESEGGAADAGGNVLLSVKARGDS